MVVEGAFALDREVGLGMLVDGQGRGRDRLLILGELGVLGANPLRAGEENRAKDAKDAKVKGTPIKGLVSYSFTRRRGGAEGAEGAEAPRDRYFGELGGKERGHSCPLRGKVWDRNVPAPERSDN